ncbi:probable E3 ubiquitin-protein ligase HECTD4, partial [Branchiostoma floridae]|uniref:Probable E3 ubiquitin-protein ligase HECTD4 n=1 Tax=Branchiostoma floridae TaxID=7739 RepID=A0A9J7N206_BRAFL
ALYKSPWARLFCYGIGHQLRKNGHVALQEVTCYPRDAAIAGTGGLTPPPLADQYPPAILPCDRVHIRVGVSPPPGYVVTIHAVPPEFALAISFIEELISVKHHVDSKGDARMEEQAASSYDIPSGAFVHLVELLGGYVWKSDVPAMLKEIMFHLLAELLRASQSRKEDGDVCLITLSPSLALLMHVNLQAELKKLYEHENKRRQRGDVIGSGEYSRFSSYFHALMEGETVTNDAVADACQTLTVPTAHSRLLVISGIPMHLEQGTVRDAIRKTDELHTVSCMNNASIVAVTETWLKEDIPDAVIALPGYDVYRRDRAARRGGGVAMYIRSELQCKRLAELDHDDHEALWMWTTEPSRKVAVLTTILKGLLDKAVPVKKVKISTADKPWMTVSIKELLAERQQAFRSGNVTLYSKLRNSVAKHIKKAKREYYEREVASLRHSSPRHWFKSIKSLMGKDSVKEDVSNPNITVTQNECDTLAEHFGSVWSEVSRTVPTLADVEHKLSHDTPTPFSIGQVKARLRRLNGRKAAGPDLIPSWLLKQYHEELGPVLCDVFNSCLQNSAFPQQWKEAVVTAVPKKQRPQFPSEYRQISLVSCVGKVYEGLLRDALLQDTASSLAPSQHGFLSRRSTVTALIHILQTWHEALNSNPKLDVHAVFVDFSRAFDTISHSQLLMCLADIGIRRSLWMSISSYLEGRTQKIYLTFIRPLLEYASPVWGGLPKHLSDKLEAMQRRCLRIIGIPSDSLPSLSDRRDAATLKTLQDILRDSSSPLREFFTSPQDILVVISGIPMHLVEQGTVRDAIRKACNMYGGLFRDEVFVPLQDKEDLPVPPAVPVSSLDEPSAEGPEEDVLPSEGGELEAGPEEAASAGDEASAAVELETQQLLASTMDSAPLPAPLASPEQDSPTADHPPDGRPPSPLGTPCIKGYAVVEIRSKSKMDDVRSALLSSRAIVGVVTYDTEELIDVTTEDMLSVSPVNLNLLSDPQGGPALGDYLKSRILSKGAPTGLTQKAQDVITEIFHRNPILPSCVVSEHAFSLESPELEQHEVVHLGKEQISLQTPMNHLHAFFTNIKGPKKSFMEQVSQVLRRYGVPKPAVKLKESEKPWKGPKLGNGKPSGKKVAQKPGKDKLALAEVTGAKAVVQKQSPGEKKGKQKQQERPGKAGKDPQQEDGAKRETPEDKYLTLEGFLLFVADKTKQDARSVWKAILACGYDLHFDRCACVDTAQAVQTSKQWTLRMDCALVDYVNALCRHLAISAARLHPHELYIREAELASPAFSCLQGVPVESLRLRFALLLSLNNTLETFFLPLVDLRPCSTYPNSTAALLSCARRLMFYDTKVVVMNSILNATAQRNPSQAAPEITLDPLEIVGGEAVTAMGTQFCQAARQLSIVPSSQLCVKLASGGDPTYSFNVRFTGEEVHGTSGSFRHFLWQVCKELQGPILNLLMLCPSATANRNKGKYILRPGPLTYGEEKLLEFLGQLLGVAVRADVPLPLDLLPPFWKGLVGLPLDEDDLREADILTYNYITRLAEAETESDFWAACAEVCPAQLQEGEGGDHPLCSFTFSSVTGEDVELCAGGRSRMLSWENRVEYLSLIRALRLEELRCANRMAPIAAGLATIVPVQVLHILTPGDLELRTCGMPHVDLAFLRSHTMYQVGLMETDTHIEFFWSSLESFSQDQLRKFVKFACNQERIPCTCPCKDGGPDTAHVPPYPMKIAPPDGPGSPDSRYIRVETCMFMIKLPQYSSQETMTERLLYAINCREDPLSG